MLLFLVSLLSFLLFLSKSLPLQPLPLGASEMRLLSVLLCKESLFVVLRWLRNSRLIATDILRIASRMSTKRNVVAKPVVVEETAEMSVIDLPELVLECILSRLPPAGLCNMASVCRSMKDMCRSDHLWKMHMEEKWGRVIGAAACREWQCYAASRSGNFAGSGGKTKGLIGILPCVWPLNWLKFKFDCGRKSRSSLPLHSIMSWYLSLESGKFWFPAQVYNRENGHVGFMLSCYDAEVSYDCHTDTFRARYPPHGRRTIVVEDGVQWDRIRTPPVETAAHDLHVSDCLTELHPGDHIEIQWRRTKEFPYGWWYGVVNHLETCDGSGFHCHCHKNDTVVLEFNQYATGSRWRRTTLNRKDHREEGNETNGFYGGIRRLQSKEEISMWRKLWPIEVLE